MKVRIEWSDENYGVQGFNIYRDTEEIDPNNLPEALAELSSDSRAYEDTSVETGTTYYYVITALVDNEEVATDNIEVLVEEGTEDPVYKTFNATGTGKDGEIQTFTAPQDGYYTIEAYGAQGGTGSRSGEGGYGAKIRGTFILKEGDVLKIGVGQKGNTDGNSEGPSGGGASWVYRDQNQELLVVAGGGGGYGVGDSTDYQDRAHAHTETWGKDGYGDETYSKGGEDGEGGEGPDEKAAAGAGWLSDGGGGSESDSGGRALSDGGDGGDGGSYPDGGFGGGGATDDSTGWGAAGGGGGYSGGGGGYSPSDGEEAAGGGGGSYNSGDSQKNESGVREGDGEVIIYNESGLEKQG